MLSLPYGIDPPTVQQVYYDRCNNFARKFRHSVNELELYSTFYNKEFFSLPLKCTKVLYERSCNILNGLTPETPDLLLLKDKADSLISLKKDTFNQMGVIADAELSLRGFTFTNLITTYRNWKLIDDNQYHSSSPAIIASSNSVPAHRQFMKVFEIPDTEIFAPVTPLEVSRLDDDQPFTEEEPVENQQKSTEVVSSTNTGDSRSASPFLTDESDGEDDEVCYLSINGGEFAMFERRLQDSC